MRRAAKVDRNQAEIIAALELVGATVTSLAAVGGGVPDLLVAHRKKWHLLEVKDGKKPPSERQLTPDQVKWHAKQQAPVHTVKSVDEALQAIGVVLPVKLDEWVRNNIG